MLPKNDKFTNAALFVNKLIIKFLVIILTIALLLSCIRLVQIFYEAIVAPPFLVISIETLFSGFSTILIIAIGYELVKSLLLIISSENIPSLPIIQIAIIAVANKIITLDAKHTDPIILFGLAALIVSLGAAYFFHNYKKS